MSTQESKLPPRVELTRSISYSREERPAPINDPMEPIDDIALFIEENFKEEGPNDKIDEKINEIVKSTRKRSLESKFPAAKRVKKEPSC